MRVIKVTLEKSLDHYGLICDYEKERNINLEIERGLSSIFLLSQNLPLKNVSDFFSGRNFPLMESYEELDTSYQLIKLGFYKQAMISLRTSMEIGLFSIYWSIIGDESQDFKNWLSSKLDTPYKNKKFWNTLRSNPNIKFFDDEFGLIDEIKNNDLSDFVHTKGMSYSNYRASQRILKGQDKFQNFEYWFDNFKKVIRIIEILHLLRFPTLNLRFSTDFLLARFGTFEKIPQFGAGFGDEMEVITIFLLEKHKATINKIADENEEVKEIKERLTNLPILTAEEISNRIMDSQKNNIRMSGFDNWVINHHIYDSRITAEMINQLEEWSKKNNLLNL